MKNEDLEVYRYDVGGLGQVVTFANVLITIVLIAGIYFDNRSATVAVLSGVAYFSFTTIITVLALSRTLTDVIVGWQREITTREHNSLPYRAATWPVGALQVTDLPRLPYTPSASLPQAPSYVAAVPRTSDTVRLAAASFVMQLFDASTGRPLPSRITRNRSQIQWKSPAPEVVEYLESLGIIYQDGGRHLYFNALDYPTLREAINAIRSGVKAKGKVSEGE